MPLDLCRKCGAPIETFHAKVYAIQGYEETRGGGGQNHVLRKQRIDGYVWHRSCWEEAIRRREGTGTQLRIEGAA